MPQCAMVNSDLKPPFHCPLDHIFNPVTFFKGAATLGVDVREIGFLDDPRVPRKIKDDVARVKVGDFFVPAPAKIDENYTATYVLPPAQQHAAAGREGEVGGIDGGGGGGDDERKGAESGGGGGGGGEKVIKGPDVEIGRDWTDDRIVEKLKPLEDRKVIMLSDMAGAMCGLSTKDENEKADHLMYNGDRTAHPSKGGILNGFDWCCWNPLKNADPPGYQPTAKPFVLPLPLGECPSSS